MGRHLCQSISSALVATIQQALAAADSLSLYLMILLGAALGLRRGEMAALMWEDIDFDEETVSISKRRVHTKRKVIEKAPKSKAGIRTFSVAMMWPMPCVRQTRMLLAS